jgi:hypothetical protein
MQPFLIDRPAPSEHAPYYGKYIGLVVEDDLLGLLRQQPDELRQLLAELGEARGAYRYAPDKWTVRQVVGHIMDTERVFAYRAFCFSRGETAPLPSFDQEAYAARYDFSDWTLAGLADAFERLRAAHLDVFEHLTPAQLEQTGTASGYLVSVRALLYMIAGHARSHLDILRTRYR